MQAKLALPVTFMAAMGASDDKYRKPAPAMFNYFCEKVNGGLSIDRAESTYCGDAAGRPATKTSKRDFSADDKMFAAGIGLKFHTPESFFLG